MKGFRKVTWLGVPVYVQRMGIIKSITWNWN